MRIMFPLLLCASVVLSATALVAAGERDQGRSDHRVDVRGVISRIDYRTKQLILTTIRGDQRIDIPVQANERTIIVENDGHRTRLRFTDLVVGDLVLVGGHFRDHVLLAGLILRS